MLERFYTDICAVHGWPRLLRLVPGPLRPARLRRLLGRIPEGVPPGKITAFTSFGWEYARRRAAARDSSEMTAAHLWAGKRFCELAIRSGLGKAAGVYTFNSAGLELLRHARENGKLCVIEQTIAPRDMQGRLLVEERERWPGWENPPSEGASLREFVEREKAEWEAADVIVCGSEFVRKGIAACGGPADRCVVVPYGIECSRFQRERRAHDGPLRVLTVGAVGLRKGSPYVLEAARRLNGRAAFSMVGSIGALPEAERELRGSVELVGPVPRSEVGKHYAWADVFLLPSLCEGSATVTYEALAAGLPVICTPNTGSIVEHGVDGFIVPVRDPWAIVEELELLMANPGLVRHMSANARETGASYSLARYRERLLRALSAAGALRWTQGALSLSFGLLNDPEALDGSKGGRVDTPDVITGRGSTTGRPQSSDATRGFPSRVHLHG